MVGVFGMICGLDKQCRRDPEALGWLIVRIRFIAEEGLIHCTPLSEVLGVVELIDSEPSG